MQIMRGIFCVHRACINERCDNVVHDKRKKYCDRCNSKSVGSVEKAEKEYLAMVRRMDKYWRVSART